MGAGLLIFVLTATLIVVNLPAFHSAISSNAAGTVSTTHTPISQPSPLKLLPNQIPVVDPPGGDRDELAGAEKMIDGKLDTGWRSNWYVGNPAFGNLKPGMGILLNLGKTYNVSSVEVQLDRPGAKLELKAGSEDPGSSAAGDGKIASTYQTIHGPQEDIGTRAVFNGKDGVQYLLIWISKLPLIGDGRYQIGVQEITVRVQ
jgi:hypothetical protein